VDSRFPGGLWVPLKSSRWCGRWAAWSATHLPIFENPTGISYWLEMGYILLVPASIVFMIGEITRSRKISWALFSVMFAAFRALYSASFHWRNSRAILLLASLELRRSEYGRQRDALYAV